MVNLCKKAFGIIVVYEESNLYLHSKEQIGLNEIIKFSLLEDLGENIRIYNKVLKKTQY